MNFSTETTELPTAMAGLRRRMLRTAIQYTRNEVDAEDLVQTALARCWERRERLRLNTNLNAWMNTVMRNLAIDESRRKGNLCRRSEDVLDVPSDVPWAPCRWEQIGVEHIEQAALACSPALRSTFTMFYFEGLSLNRIAERCRISPRTAATRVHRARKKIRDILESRLPPVVD